MKDLKELIADAIEDWKVKKIQNADIDDDIDFEIFSMVQNATNRIFDELEDLNDNIDYLMEDTVSNYDWDLEQDAIQRTNDLREG